MLQHGVAGWVAVGVVSHFEVVDVNHEQAGRLSKNVARRDDLLDVLVEGPAVEQSGQGANRALLTLLLELDPQALRCAARALQRADPGVKLGSDGVRPGLRSSRAPASRRVHPTGSAALPMAPRLRSRWRAVEPDAGP